MAEKEIDYQQVLADLKEKRAKSDAAYAAAIEGIESMLGQSGMGSAQNGKPMREEDIPSDAFFGMPIVEATKKYLKIVKGKKPTPEIVQALEQGGMLHSSKNFLNTVFAGLYRDQKQGGGLVRVRGDWGLQNGIRGEEKVSAIKLKTPKRC